MYFITCFQKYDPTKRGVPDIGSARTFGYYTDRDVAIELVKKNCCGIQEYCYRYAVIEKIDEGLYNPAEERIFFEWDNIKNQFIPIDPFIDDCGNYAFG